MGGQSAADFFLMLLLYLLFLDWIFYGLNQGIFFLLQVFVCYYLNNFVNQCQLLSPKPNQCPGLSTVQVLLMPVIF